MSFAEAQWGAFNCDVHGATARCVGKSGGSRKCSVCARSASGATGDPPGPTGTRAWDRWGWGWMKSPAPHLESVEVPKCFLRAWFEPLLGWPGATLANRSFDVQLILSNYGSDYYRSGPHSMCAQIKHNIISSMWRWKRKNQDPMRISRNGPTIAPFLRVSIWPGPASVRWICCVAAWMSSWLTLDRTASWSRPAECDCWAMDTLGSGVI